MKIKGLLALGCVFLLHAPQAAELHEFNLPDGRSVKAEIVGYNARLGKVELKLANGSRKKVSPSLFVQADQDFIQDWAALDGFRNPRQFKVECDEKTVEKWKKESDAHEIKYEKVVYEIKLQNKTPADLNSLTAEYQIYYEQEKSVPGKNKETVKLQKAGKFDLKKMRTKEVRTLKTEPVVLESYSFNSAEYYYDSGDPENTEGEIEGIWLRITAKTPNGQTAVRDIYEPSSLKGKYSW